MNKQVEFLKTLLSKYISHVLDCEGSNFLSDMYLHNSEIKFSEKEIELLKSL